MNERGRGDAPTGRLRLRCGEEVEVKSLEEIVRTLDQNGALDGLPFMPEMVPYCGGRYRVHKRADRTCCPPYKARGMDDTVWLEDVRCDGGSHSACGARCMIFWKEAWLRRPAEHGEAGSRVVGNSGGAASGLLSRVAPAKDEVTGRYLCQASLLQYATYPLGIIGNIRTYLMDLRYGNLSLYEFLRVNGLWLISKLPVLKRHARCAKVAGTLTKTPVGVLNLQPGELVRVKNLEEIIATLSTGSMNRGLGFQPEMRQFCGGEYRVLARLDNVVNEMNGELFQSKNTVVLEGVTCDGVCRRGCGRRGYTYWREIWLERVGEAPGAANSGGYPPR